MNASRPRENVSTLQVSQDRNPNAILTKHRWKVAALAMSVALIGLAIAAARVAATTQHDISCWTYGQGTNTCSGDTYDLVANNEHQSSALSFAWGGLDIYTSVDTRGTNYFFPGTLAVQETCERGGGGGCETPWVGVCPTASFPNGCGSGYEGWYMTTYHYFDNGTTYFEIWSATDTSNGRESYYCWINLNCF
jgi:hypothetical protein